ncbi:MAG: putative capsid protein [Circoviridae sp.]|nr:MAG: putative capsid protein [Circoviridae sp.]
MPKRKYIKSDRKYGPSKRRRRQLVRRRRKNYIPRGLFAKTTKMAFNYSDTITLDPNSTSNFVYHTFNANSLYNPDHTGVITDHRAYGFSEYMQFYNHYCVIACKLKATFVTKVFNNNQIAPVYVGLMQSAGATPDQLDINTVMETKQSHIKVSTTTAAPKTITANVNLSKALGQKVLQEDNNSGTVTSSPAEGWFIHLMAASNEPTVVNPDPIRVKVDITYIAILHEPKIIAGS